MRDLVMTINGQAVPSSALSDVINPATGAPFATVPECSPEQLDAAMDAADKAYVEWSQDIEMRRLALRECSRVLSDNAVELGPVLTSEQGKPLSDAVAEVMGAGMWFDYFADLDIHETFVQDDATGRARVLRRPLGVVAAITPWNFPIVLAMWKLAPALLAGNTVVLKPSPYTPATTLLVGELLSSVLPPGVVNVITGGDELGRAMTAHRVPRKISFTGSVAAGRSVALAAASDLKRVTLELGGNDAAILLDDVDPVQVAEKLFWGAFQNNGQVCCAVKRVYAHDSIYKDVVQALADIARSVKVGDGTLEGSQLGPINNLAQFDRVQGLVQDAIQSGATAAAGGSVIDGPGYFFEPTILADVTDGVRIVDEEQFGPVLPVISFRDDEEALQRANATQFGLGGSVWSADSERAAMLARRLECGTAWVNTHLAVGPHQPFGGAKSSGLGVENGIWGYEGFTDLQVLHEAM